MKKQTPNDFNFWLPIDFMKSDAAEYPRGDDRRYENMIFEGIASDDSKDKNFSYIWLNINPH